MSRRTTELLYLVLAGAVSTMAYVSVYAGRYREIDRASIVYGLIFVAIFLVLHVVVRVFLPQADPLPAADHGAARRHRAHRDLPHQAVARPAAGPVAARRRAALRAHGRDRARPHAARPLPLPHRRRSASSCWSLTIVAGTTVNGAKLWIHAFGMSIQPSEFAKLAIVIFLAGYLNDKKVLLSVPTRHVLGVPVPAPKYFGPLVVMWVLSLLHAGLHEGLRHVAALPGDVRGAALHGHDARSSTWSPAAGSSPAARRSPSGWCPHVQRPLQHLDRPLGRTPTTRATSCCSRCSRSPTAACSGAGFGRGFLLYSNRQPVVPDLQTDFIFAAIANEIGLLGAVAVVLCFLLFFWRGVRIATQAPDGFSKLLAAGLATAFGLQTFIILGGVTRLIPLTGITLPFVSYGGSSITANLVLVALLLMVSHRTNVVRAGTDLERRRLAELG